MIRMERSILGEWRVIGSAIGKSVAINTVIDDRDSKCYLTITRTNERIKARSPKYGRVNLAVTTGHVRDPVRQVKTRFTLQRNVLSMDQWKILFHRSRVNSRHTNTSQILSAKQTEILIVTDSHVQKLSVRRLCAAVSRRFHRATSQLGERSRNETVRTMVSRLKNFARILSI